MDWNKCLTYFCINAFWVLNMTLPLLQFEIVEIRPRQKDAGQVFVVSAKDRVVILGDELPIDAAIECIADNLRRRRARSMIFTLDMAQIDCVCEGHDSFLEVAVVLMNLSFITSSLQQRQEIANQIITKASVNS